jgi:hypothetical protein
MSLIFDFRVVLWFHQYKPQGNEMVPVLPEKGSPLLFQPGLFYAPIFELIKMIEVVMT